MSLRRALRGIFERRLAALPPWGEDRLAQNAVVIAPHPDDETLGCGGTILKKRALGAEVAIVFVSDGAASHPRLVAPDEMRAIREREALAAASVLGVDPRDVVFLRHADGRLAASVESAARDVAAILEQRRPRQVFVPHRLEPPPDHVAAYRIGRAAVEAAGGSAAMLEYPVWLWQHPPWARMEHYAPRSRAARLRAAIRANAALLREFRTAVYVGDVLDRKRAALERHASQMARRDGDPRWSTLADIAGGELLSCCLRDVEIFCESPAMRDGMSRR